MSPRVAGAALALLAAVMLVASVVGIPTGWWSGAPIKNGVAMHKKDVDVSLLHAVGCNPGGDGHCEPVPLASGFATVRYVALGVTGLLALLALILAGMTLTASESRKKVSVAVIVLAGLSAMIAVGLIFMPKLESAAITLPIGPGLYVFFGGIALAILGSVLARRPTPKLELQPSRQPYAPALAAQPVDVLALLHAETPPATPDSRPPPSPGGQLAGPAGPLGQGFGQAAPYPTMPTPAAFAAPEPPRQIPPTPPPLLPPTLFPGQSTPFPAPPAPFSVRPGVPPLATPPPPDARNRSATGAPPIPDRGKSSSPMPAVPGTSSSPMPAVPDRGKSSSPMPAVPDRSKSSTHAPAIPGKGSGSVPAMPDARPKSPSVPPPSAAAASAAARTKAASVGAIDRPKSPSVAPLPVAASLPSAITPIPSTVAGMLPPARAKGATGLPPPRGKGPSVPPPAKLTTVAAVVPPPAGGPLVSTKLPVRADTDPTDHLETMDRDAMTLARDTASIGDSTDASIAMHDAPPDNDHTDLAAEPINPDTGADPRDSASDIQTSMQRKLTQSELVRTVARESQSEIETIAREKLSASDLAIGDSTSPAVISAAAAIPRGASQSDIDELGEAATVPATSAAPRGGAITGTAKIASLTEVAKIPMSTASESLPPPKKEEVATSGPTPACPQCEAPMAWVEEHLRFYCKSCRMYF